MRYKQFIFAYVCFFALGAAAPIALNQGAAAFDGGTVVTQVGAPDGADAAPSYSFSGETNLGYYRISAGNSAFTVDTGLTLRMSATANLGQLYWDTDGDASSDVANPAIIGTDANTGIVYATRASDFVLNGDGIAGIRSSATGAGYGGFCFDASNTAPCFNMIAATSGKLVLSTVNNQDYNGTFDLGADGSIESSVASSYSFDGDTDTGLGSTVNTLISVYSANTSRTSFNSTVVQSTAAATFMSLSECSSDPPPAGDCDADAERGRLCLRSAVDKVYLCGGATRGWDHIVLTNDATK